VRYRLNEPKLREHIYQLVGEEVVRLMFVNPFSMKEVMDKIMPDGEPITDLNVYKHYARIRVIPDKNAPEGTIALSDGYSVVSTFNLDLEEDENETA